MDYVIRYSEDLPDGHDFLLVRTCHQVVVVYRESALSPRVLEDSWAAYRALVIHPPRELLPTD